MPIYKSTRFWTIILVVYLCLFGALITYWGAGSAWLGGDFQTINTERFWLRDGILQHSGLFLVQGYTPFIKIFESPELNHHGLASVRYMDGNVVQSIYYNHYPSGYLFPIFIFSKIFGVDSLTPLNLMQYLLSCVSLFFFYLFLNEIFRNKNLALFGTFLYSLSYMFLNFSYTLANHPIDDLTRFICLWLIVKIKREANKKLYIALFLSYAILSLSSLDSLLFVFVFQIFYDLLDKKINLKIWGSLAGIAVLGKIIQLAQSAREFGMNGAIADFTTSFSQRALEMNSAAWWQPIKQRFYAISLEWAEMFTLTPNIKSERLFYALLFGLFLIVIAYLFFKHSRPENRPKYKTLLSLVIAGSVYALAVPVAGYMAYQGRQWVPALIVAICLIYADYRHFPSPSRSVSVVFTTALSILFVYTGLQTWEFGRTRYVFPFDGYSTSEKILAESIREIASKPETDIVIMVKNTPSVSSQRNVGFSYQMSSHISAVSDRFIMETFGTKQTLEDIKNIRKLTQGRATFVVLSQSEKDLRKIYSSFRSSFCVSMPQTAKVTNLYGYNTIRLDSCEN